MAKTQSSTDFNSQFDMSIFGKHSALYGAFYRNDIKNAKGLYDIGHRFNVGDDQDLAAVLANINRDSLEIALNMGADPNGIYKKHSVLYWSFYNEKVSYIRSILKRGGKFTDTEKGFILARLAYEKKFTLLPLAIEAGADLDGVDTGESALGWTVRHADEATFKLLFAAGATIPRNDIGTFIDLIIAGKHWGALKFAFKHNVSLNLSYPVECIYFAMQADIPDYTDLLTLLEKVEEVDGEEHVYDDKDGRVKDFLLKFIKSEQPYNVKLVRHALCLLDYNSRSYKELRKITSLSPRELELFMHTPWPTAPVDLRNSQQDVEFVLLQALRGQITTNVSIIERLRLQKHNNAALELQASLWTEIYNVLAEQAGTAAGLDRIVITGATVPAPKPTVIATVSNGVSAASISVLQQFAYSPDQFMAALHDAINTCRRQPRYQGEDTQTMLTKCEYLFPVLLSQQQAASPILTLPTSGVQAAQLELGTVAEVNSLPVVQQTARVYLRRAQTGVNGDLLLTCPENITARVNVNTIITDLSQKRQSGLLSQKRQGEIHAVLFKLVADTPKAGANHQDDDTGKISIDAFWSLYQKHRLIPGEVLGFEVSWAESEAMFNAPSFNEPVMLLELPDNLMRSNSTSFHGPWPEFRA